MMKMPEPDTEKIKEISEDILKSMLKRSYPAVNAVSYFKKYADGKTPDPQFMHALAMMDKGGILRIDNTKKPFSVTFVLMEDGKPKMHHMIDDDYSSSTFGSLINDPYEGDKKRSFCYEHLEAGYTEGCKKCKAEKNSQICMMHENVLSECDECKKSSQNLKALTTKDKSQEVITRILKQYKDQYWSYEK